MAKIMLPGGVFAVIDDCDEHWLSRFKWVVMQPERSHTAYAATLIGNQVVYMHRLVVGTCGKGMQVDHIDHDGLNNQRANLRTCHYMQNSHNSRKIAPKGASRFKGVRAQASGRWRAEVRRGGRRISIGTHATELEAAKAFDAKVTELDGPYACTNKDMGLY